MVHSVSEMNNMSKLACLKVADVPVKWKPGKLQWATDGVRPGEASINPEGWVVRHHERISGKYFE